MINPAFLVPSTWIKLGVIVVMHAAPFLLTKDWIETHPHRHLFKHLKAQKRLWRGADGACHGYGLTTSFTWLRGTNDVFKQDLAIVASLQLNDVEKLKKDNTQSFDNNSHPVARVLDTIAFNQMHSLYPERFPENTFLGLPDYPQQKIGVEQAATLLPDVYKGLSTEPIVLMYSGVRAYSYSELKSNMFYLEGLFKQRNERYSVLFGIMGHAFACLYNPEDNTWLIDDVNFGSDLKSKDLSGPHSTESASENLWEWVRLTELLSHPIRRFGFHIIQLLDSLATGTEPRSVLLTQVLGTNQIAGLADNNENQINILAEQAHSFTKLVLNFYLLSKAIVCHDTAALRGAMDLQCMNMDLYCMNFASSLLSSIASGNSEAVTLILNDDNTSFPISDEKVKSFMPMYKNFEELLNKVNPRISNIVRNHEKYRKMPQ